MKMAAVRAFIVDPVTFLVIEDVSQILLDRRRSLAVHERWTRSMTASGRWTRSPLSLLELSLELMDELVLLLDNKVLGLDIRHERVIVVFRVGLVMRLRLGPCRHLTLLGD